MYKSYDIPPQRAWRIPCRKPNQSWVRASLSANAPKAIRQTYTTNNKDSLEITSLDLANLDSLLPDFLSLLVVQEEPSLIIHQVLDRVLVDWGLTTLGGGSYDLEIV